MLLACAFLPSSIVFVSSMCAAPPCVWWIPPVESALAFDAQHTRNTRHTHIRHTQCLCVYVFAGFVPCFVRNTRINELNTQTSLSSHIVYADRTRAEHQLACATNKILAILAYRI